MGLDVVLSVLVLIWAVRGWMKGFLVQAVGLGALALGVYAASPLRDLVRPHAAKYLPTIEPAVLDRLMWWVVFGFTLVLVSGLGTWLVRLTRKRTYVPAEPNRTDQGAGFVLGAVKGLIAASFLVAAYQRYVPEELKHAGMVEEYAKNSRALVWSVEYEPAKKIWEMPAVQAVVAQVKKHGLGLDASATEAEAPAPAETAGGGESVAPGPGAGANLGVVKTARRGLTPLVIPGESPAVGSEDWMQRLEREVESLEERAETSR